MLLLALALVGCTKTVADDTDDSDASAEVCDNGADDDGDGDVDCEDADCDLDPACAPDTESDCNDGVDNDLDGVIDCDDVDCTEACVEDCADGVDNDGDGLLDCEDDECVGDDACFEDCADGVDNDLDTFTDCDDDECWGKDACTNRTVQTTGFGSMGGPYRQRQAHWYREWAGGYSSGGTVQFTHSEVVTDVTGTLAIERDTGVVECGWTVDTATFSQQLVWGYGETSGVYYDVGVSKLQNRSGWATSGDCGGVDSSVLPGRLFWDISGLYFLSQNGTSVLSLGGLWYAGSFNYTSTYFSTERYTETAAGGYSGSYTYGLNAQVWWEPTGPGDPWTVSGL